MKVLLRNKRLKAPLLTSFVMILVIFVLAGTGAFAFDWLSFTNNQIANAIYKAEGGAKAKKPFGILSVKCDGYDECRQICINTVRNNRKRFANQIKYDDFIEFLGSRYCPIGADNDNGTNKYWVKNVKIFLERGD